MAHKPPDLSQLSHASRKYLRDGPGWVSFTTPPFRQQLCFVYGSLMDPKTLANVLGRPDPPEMQPAKAIGYKIMMWGQYPALVDMPNNTVYGMTFQVDTEEEVKRLQAYETSHYTKVGCYIYLRNHEEEEMSGMTFVWAGEKEELREGQFDLKDWQMKRLEMELAKR